MVSIPALGTAPARPGPRQATILVCLIVCLATAWDAAIEATHAWAWTPTRTVLTSDGRPYILTHSSPGTVIVRAPGSAGGNEREVIWPLSASPEADSTSCSEWKVGQGIDQQGAAFRFTSANGALRGITVTRNVWANAFWAFNFHTWDTSSTSVPFSQFASVDLSGYLGTGPAVYPLKFCARTDGDNIQFIVWRPGEAEPAWGSTSQGGSATIPASAPTAGYTGWYVGHVEPGTMTTFSDMRIDGALPVQG